MSDKQIQKAGDGAQQIQMINPTIVMGIDEKRAREVYSEMSVKAMQDCTAEAIFKAEERIKKFADLLIPRIENIEKDFRSFTEPSFQFLLRSAQKAAACTEREADYELLSELLVHRIENSESRKKKASIAKAVEIVDQIDDDALCGITIMNAINNWGPIAGNIISGLNVLNNLYESLLYQELPKGVDWIYHLDILGAVRISSLEKFKKTKDYIQEVCDGYVCVGIEIGSENHKKALEILTNANLFHSMLIEHELLEGYVRIPVRSKQAIPEITVIRNMAGIDTPFHYKDKVNSVEIKAIEEIFLLYEKNESKLEKVKDSFNQKWDTFESLRKITDWHDNIPWYFQITPVGTVLAHANAKRYHSKIPDLKI